MVRDIPAEWMPTKDELPGSLREIAEAIGVDGAVKLSLHFGGCRLYVRDIGPSVRKKRNAVIRQERGAGASVHRLSRRYELSQRMIEQILASADS